MAIKMQNDMKWDTQWLNRLETLVKKMRTRGADEAQAVYGENISASVNWCMGKAEEANWSQSSQISLRALVGKKEASISSDLLDESYDDALIERVVTMAHALPEDPYAGLARADQLYDPSKQVDLDLYDPIEVDLATLIDTSKRCEDAARAHPSIVNSKGAGAEYSKSTSVHYASNGFQGTHQSSNHSIGIYAIAGNDDGMEGDYDFSSKVHIEDLESPEELGRSAAEKAHKRLSSRKIKSCKAPVVFNPRVGNSIIRHFADAIYGNAIARGTSFLKDKMGTKIFSTNICIIDDPFIKRFQGSRNYDSDGLACSKTTLIDSGELQSWMLNLKSARQLDMEPTGHGSGISNLYMQAGDIALDDMIGDIKQGFYCTSLMGRGANITTGDYSRGASGFWIENGKITWPVDEVTIAGNLNDMFATLQPCNDLEFKYSVNVAHFMIPDMTIAGN